MQNIDYTGILKKSWQITWSNKYLWWFGFFLALGSFGGGPNWSGSSTKNTQSNDEISSKLGEFVANYWQWLILAAIFLFIIILLIAVLKLICQAGIIKSGNDLIKGQASSFKKGFLEGKKYFWKLFFLSFIVSFFMLGVVLALLSPVIFLALIKSYFWAIIFGIAALMMIVVLSIVASFVWMYAVYYITLSDLGIKNSLENSFQLFKNNFVPSIIFALIFFALGIIFNIALFLILIVLGLVFLALGFLMNAIMSKTGILIDAIVGGLVLSVVLFFSQAVFETFRQISWLLLFREIASGKSEEKVAVMKTYKPAEKVLDAEGA